MVWSKTEGTEEACSLVQLNCVRRLSVHGQNEQWTWVKNCFKLGCSAVPSKHYFESFLHGSSSLLSLKKVTIGKNQSLDSKAIKGVLDFISWLKTSISET